MTPTTAIALYAAVVATAAVLWQIYTRMSDRRTIVKVKLEHEVDEDRGHDGVLATVVNHGFRPVQVVSVAIEGNEGRWPEYGGWLRGEESQHGLGERGVGRSLASREQVRTGFGTEELEMDNFDLHRPIRAVAVLGDGTQIRSSPIVVKP